MSVSISPRAAVRRRSVPTLAVSTLVAAFGLPGCADEPALGPPTVDLLDVTLSEGDDASTEARVVVQLSHPAPEALTGVVRLTSGTALAGADFEGADIPLLIPRGAASAEVAIPVLGDERHEPTEVFTVELLDLLGGMPGDLLAEVTLTDDDPAPTITVDDAAVDENDVAGRLTFVVRLAAPSPDPVTVDFATSDGTARAGDDYLAVSGTLTFAPGELEKSIEVDVIDDGVDEPNVHDFTLSLSNPTGPSASVADATAVGAIGDDEAAPTLSITGTSLAEGTSGETVAIVSLTLSHPSEAAITASYTTQDGSAVAPSDYAAANGSFTLPAGETVGVLEFAVVSDTAPEVDEDFTVVLSNVQQAVISTPSAAVTLQNDDLPVVSVMDASGVERDGTSLGSIAFPIQLSQAAPFEVRVSFAVVIGASSTATASDVAIITGTRVFAPGVTLSTLVLGIRPDDLTEPAETFEFNLSNPTSATLGRSMAIGTIIDDD